MHTIHMQRDMDRLQQSILSMLASVEEAVYKAVKALQERSVELAEEIIEGEDQIDEDENVIESECLKILALHQPVATDLRRVIVALKIITDLERMGDLAEDIAERAIALATMPPINIPTHVQKMTDLTTSMVRESLDSFVNLDSRMARKVIRLDDEVDRYNIESINDVIEIMKKSPDNVEPGLSVFSAIRHLERIADHATNIAEEVVYLAEGELIRHRPDIVNE